MKTLFDKIWAAHEVAPGASVWRETSARWPGSGGVRIS